MEDIRIGSRIWARRTLVNAGVSLAFTGNGARIGISLAMNVSTAITNCQGRIYLSEGANNNTWRVVNAAMPNAEVWLWPHGSTVYEPFTAQAVNQNMVVTEYFLDNQQDAPSPPRFPGVGIRGPIPTATP